MKKFLCLLLLSGSGLSANEAEEWITILVHGAVGFAANLSLQTIIQAQRDSIEGTKYEANVLKIREHPYLFTLQPMQSLGLQQVKKTSRTLNASYIFGELYQEMQTLCACPQKNYFYTYGWSGLISEKRRYEEAREFYLTLRKLIATLAKKNDSNKRKKKLRLIGYSHGATFILNFADLRAKEFCRDTFIVDELYCVGIPVTDTATRQIQSPVFKKVYSIYSRGDKVQRLDIFSKGNFFSHRVFKGCFKNVKQIEFRYSAPLRNSPCHCLPPNMRGTIDQSAGHIELWFFGWTPSNYRKNLHMYPLSAAIFIPYLVCAAEKACCSHVRVDIRPDLEKSYLKNYASDEFIEVPFFKKDVYTKFINKALEYHPSRSEFKESFIEMQTSIDISAYR